MPKAGSSNQLPPGFTKRHQCPATPAAKASNVLNHNSFVDADGDGVEDDRHQRPATRLPQLQSESPVIVDTDEDFV